MQFLSLMTIAKGTPSDCSCTPMFSPAPSVGSSSLLGWLGVVLKVPRCWKYLQLTQEVLRVPRLQSKLKKITFQILGRLKGSDRMFSDQNPAVNATANSGRHWLHGLVLWESLTYYPAECHTKALKWFLICKLACLGTSTWCCIVA